MKALERLGRSFEGSPAENRVNAAIEAHRKELEALRDKIAALENAGESEHYEAGYRDGVADATANLTAFLEGGSE